MQDRAPVIYSLAGRELLLRILPIFLCILVSAPAHGQIQKQVSKDFIATAQEKIEKTHGMSLFEACPLVDDLASETVFKEYGAIFAAGDGVTIPSRCIFPDESSVAEFQKGLTTSSLTVGGVRITLQKSAMDALLAARKEAASSGLSITPRGGSRAGARTFAATLDLWNSRFLPALQYWTRRGRITRSEADEIRKAPITRQVSQVLEWEKEGIYFARGFSKSILFSVAAPGASQHISMLALDVSQFGNKRVREILARHGWFQTVRSDYPHFTYLGRKESELAGLGLEQVTIGGHVFWVPDLKEKD